MIPETFEEVEENDVSRGEERTNSDWDEEVSLEIELPSAATCRKWWRQRNLPSHWSIMCVLLIKSLKKKNLKIVKRWIDAMNDDIQAIEKNETWELT